MKSSEQISKKLGQFGLQELTKFAEQHLSSPTTKINNFFHLKTIDGFPFVIWGENEEWILKEFERYLQIRFYI